MDHRVELAATFCESRRIERLIRRRMAEADRTNRFVAVRHAQLEQGLCLSIKQPEVDGAHSEICGGQQDQHYSHRSVELPIWHRPERLIHPVSYTHLTL